MFNYKNFNTFKNRTLNRNFVLMFNNRYRIFFISFVFRLLFVSPVLVFTGIMGMEHMLLIWLPIGNCLLCMLVANLNFLYLKPKYYMVVLLCSIIFTIVLRLLVIPSVFNIIMVLGGEWLVLLLLESYTVDLVVLRAVIPLAGIANPDNIDLQAFDPNAQNRNLGINLANELARPEYKNKEMSTKMVGQYGCFILGVIQNSTNPEGIAMNQKLLANWNANSNRKVPWWTLSNTNQLRNVLRNA
uniref:hypothetical protein n=1 Tax=Periconia digitata TaxID=1303443 RepID=UPI0023AA498A|nr:hypothetical protein P1Q94_mgp05 [Periconia digitata]WCA44851.1 hypothetical protein [Periconia digitata]